MSLRTQVLPAHAAPCLSSCLCEVSPPPSVPQPLHSCSRSPLGSSPPHSCSEKKKKKSKLLQMVRSRGKRRADIGEEKPCCSRGEVWQSQQKLSPGALSSAPRGGSSGRLVCSARPKHLQLSPGAPVLLLSLPPPHLPLIDWTNAHWYPIRLINTAPTWRASPS